MLEGGRWVDSESGEVNKNHPALGIKGDIQCGRQGLVWFLICLFHAPFPLTHTSDTTHTPFSFLPFPCDFLLYFGNLTTQVTALGFQPGIHSKPMKPNLFHLSLLVIASPELNLRMYACQGKGWVAKEILIWFCSVPSRVLFKDLLVQSEGLLYGIILRKNFWRSRLKILKISDWMGQWLYCTSCSQSPLLCAPQSGLRWAKLDVTDECVVAAKRML